MEATITQQSTAHSTRDGTSRDWARRVLDINVTSGGRESTLPLDALVRIALRRNPKRAHLLVSTVVGRHLPTSPAVLRAASRLLSESAAAALDGRNSDLNTVLRDATLEALTNPSAESEQALQAALTHSAAPELSTAPPAVVAFAEAATALGQLVADDLSADSYIHSTHQLAPDFTGPRIPFEEPHSHAADHFILPADTASLVSNAPLLLVDDEVSTGTTALNTIEALHAVYPRDRYVVAALIDLRTAEDTAKVAEFAANLGVTIDIVTLAAGVVTVPDVAVRVGQELAAVLGTPAPRPWPYGAPEVLTGAWPSELPRNGIHSLNADQMAAINDAALAEATRLDSFLPKEGKVLVLGVEEFQHVPMLLAHEWERNTTTRRVRFGAATRSPITPLARPGYPIQSAASYRSTEEQGETRYLYNVFGPHLPDAVVLVLPPETDKDLLNAPGGLLETIRGAAPHVVVIQY